MKTEDFLLVGALAVVGFIAYKIFTGKSAAPVSDWIGNRSAADTIYNRYPGVPYSADTTIPMQPGGGY